jgi:hypothetical protein
MMRNQSQKYWLALVAIAVFANFAPAVHADEKLPAGARIIVSLNQSVSSKDAKQGQKLDGSVASAVVVGRKTVIPKGARVNLSVASVQESGRLSTPAKLWLTIDSIELKGREYPVNTAWAGEDGQSHAKRDAVAIGGGSALGAVIGGIAGGGKGAVIGAAAGAGAGTAGAAATGKKDITFPAETQLVFTTKKPLRID